MSMVPPPASTIRSPFPLYSHVVNDDLLREPRLKTHLDGIACKAALNTKVQASFTLSDE